MKPFRGVLLHGDLSMRRPSAIVILVPPGAAIFVLGLALIVIFPVGCVKLEGEQMVMIKDSLRRC